ncbi:MAG: type II toxin-antitoxin system RelE/ParE family toxin [Cytophagales bacterium]
MEVVISERALVDVDKIVDYISEQGYPETALKYANRTYDFCLTINNFPLKYNLCKYATYRKYGYRCAIFENTYVIAFKIEKGKMIVIKRIIHGNRLS